MEELLDKIAVLVEHSESTAHCAVNATIPQITVTFDERPDVSLSLLTPTIQNRIKIGRLDEDDISELLHFVKKTAHFGTYA